MAGPVFAEALNQEIEAWGLGDPIDPAELPTVGRWAWLSQQMGSKAASLNKNRVAQRVVDLATPDDPMKGSRKVLGPRLTQPLAQLHASLQARLQEQP